MKTLLQKLADIREKVTVEKLGYNDYHKYYYVREEDAIKAVRGFLIEEKIFILPDFVYAGREGDIATVNASFTFVNLEEPFDKETFRLPAQGQDKGDKGIYKAETGALKQVLLKVFLMSSGDDPEYEGGESTKRTFKAESRTTTPKSDGAAKEGNVSHTKTSPEPPTQVPKAQIPPFETPNNVMTKEARNAYLKELAQKVGPAKQKRLGEWIRNTSGEKDLRKLTDEKWAPILATLKATEASNNLDEILEASK